MRGEQTHGEQAQKNSEDWMFHNATTEGNDEQKQTGEQKLEGDSEERKTRARRPNQAVKKEDKHDQIEFKHWEEERRPSREMGWHNY